ncbi:hypothetical protein KP509_09G041100 [Ceratopteris richardii]|uniref:Uncharacterized protein n=1 Tax=Ceratopteris richardii TaxID=49495 RepID=A0A8T2U3P4_CERRI|nr:hypothetical protein KP509_09G041100 [Ceratopteris richardii]
MGVPFKFQAAYNFLFLHSIALSFPCGTDFSTQNADTVRSPRYPRACGPCRRSPGHGPEGTDSHGRRLITETGEIFPRGLCELLKPILLHAFEKSMRVATRFDKARQENSKILSRTSGFLFLEGRGLESLLRHRLLALVQLHTVSFTLTPTT